MINSEEKKKLEEIMIKYEDSISDIKDLIDDNEPSKLFFLLINLFGHLLDNEPSSVISPVSISLRKKLNSLFKILGPNFLSCKQVIENRKNLKSGLVNDEPDQGIDIPKNPVIWMPNHHFKDDALATVLAAYRNAYIAFGSLPQFYNTVDGLTAWINGVLILNRNNQASKKAFMNKADYAMELGADLIIYPEGVWNKSPNQLVLHLWPGIYRIAKKRNSLIVPIVHYIDHPEIMSNTNTIHTVVDDPINISNMKEKEALEYLRDVLAYWSYLMIERYGKTTRNDLLAGYASSQEAWEEHLKKRISTADRYDFEIETKADYRPRNMTMPYEVFDSVANINNITADNIKLVLAAKKKIYESNVNDFQRRF